MLNRVVSVISDCPHEMWNLQFDPKHSWAKVEVFCSRTGRQKWWEFLLYWVILLIHPASYFESMHWFFSVLIRPEVQCKDYFTKFDEDSGYEAGMQLIKGEGSMEGSCPSSLRSRKQAAKHRELQGREGRPAWSLDWWHRCCLLPDSSTHDYVPVPGSSRKPTNKYL